MIFSAHFSANSNAHFSARYSARYLVRIFVRILVRTSRLVPTEHLLVRVFSTISLVSIIKYA